MKDRRNVPHVDGAIALWPSNSPVAPHRSTSTSSMQSPPATIDWINVITFRPGRLGARPITEINHVVGQGFDPELLGQ